MSHLLKKWLWSLLRIVEMINLVDHFFFMRILIIGIPIHICERTQTYASLPPQKTTLAHKLISEIISSCGHNPN